MRRRELSIGSQSNVAAALAAKAATSKIPIIFSTGADPVQFGLVSNLNRPDGNVTGVAILSNTLVPKQLELLREVVPTATLVASTHLGQLNQPDPTANCTSGYKAGRNRLAPYRVMGLDRSTCNSPRPQTRSATLVVKLTF